MSPLKTRQGSIFARDNTAFYKNLHTIFLSSQIRICIAFFLTTPGMYIHFDGVFRLWRMPKAFGLALDQSDRFVLTE